MLVRTMFIAAASFGAAAANANSVITVDLLAAGDGRFLDTVSQAYAQIDLTPDGMYSLVDDSPFGAVNAFPSEGDWDGVGALTLDGTATGIGVETIDILSAVFDFDQYIDGSLVTFGDYTTAVVVNSGSVELTNGIVTDITLDATTTFTVPVLGALAGNLSIGSGAFTLDAGAPEFGAVWDFDGSASSPTVIPEPASAAVLLLGAMALAARRRRAS